MKTIYKYPIEIRDRQIIQAPIDSKPILAGLDPNGKPCIWMEINKEYQHIPHPMTVYIFGTGFDIPDNLKHFQSFKQDIFIWHVYLD